MDKNKKVRCLLLLSGGLDSTLAVKLLINQGIEVSPINFATSFCGPKKARVSALHLGLALREINIKNEFVDILKKPKHGYGAGMNPCIDCHGIMLKKAKQVMDEEGFDFVATGEVLNERPMSQNKRSLKIVEKDAGLEGYLLRPLSAQVLEPTIPELDGRVDREKLLNISGRNRKIQIALAEKFGIKDYPTPAGGCALTQEDFAKRVSELFKNQSSCTLEDVELLKVGRQIWQDGVRMVVGRNEVDNERIKRLVEPNDIILEPINISGPTMLLRAREITESNIEQALKIEVKYIKSVGERDKILFTCIRNGVKETIEFIK
ncbi:MAG: tRNA 4-thiouridine(8) synthase ThiI [Candidatus Portnoybacteria bacterium CG10_big_fil_rev_8_21_14_0_10_36_7]|uniref:tRNA 4-thiouridine(8) synthase ThiI n=1 Tax=Candidatus Portnoybacteria bacterium CG10_big_fil_rev_8_21_14_0_10_36_7 TaxID=1974812 RepID=A0A2M8KD72_9BACT|nr:MAG: tRNA 4-thiouridine(8) synthase ThiI [Candidatus Portnoybacteria bacterium CG10_big_fil_rev_8_21_14_0_10_36_7]